MLLSALTIVAALAAPGTEPAGGRLCYTKAGERLDSLAACTDTPGTTSATVSPSSNNRVFLWVREGGHEASVGLIKSGETKADLSPAAKAPVPQFPESDEDAWQPVDVELISDSVAIRFELSAASIPALKTLRVPAGFKEVRFSARHYFPETLTLSSKTPPRIWMRRVPSIAGKVVDGETGMPIERAAISATRLSSTTSDAGGRFKLEIADQWPTHIEVMSAGKGTAVIELPPARADIQLPAITLRAGGTVVAGLVHNTALRAEIARVGPTGERVITQRNLTADDTELRVEDLSAGTYTLHLIGTKPLQHFAQTFEIHAGQETYVDVLLAPRMLEIEVRHRGDTVRDASIEIMHTGPNWQASVTPNNTGRIVEEFWQPGSYGLMVNAPGSAVFFTTKKAPDKDNVLWTVDLPTRRLHGTVIDSETKAPVANADVGMETSTTQSSVQRRAITAADGTFAFEGIPSGEQLLAVKAHGYVKKVASHHSEEGEEDASLEIPLIRAVQITLAITKSDGSPASGAVVIDSLDPESSELIANAQGQCELSLTPGEKATFFVIPTTGSFAVAHVNADAGSGVVNVTVPEGSATIRFEAIADGPVPVVNLLTRYNNELIRPHVIDAFYHAQANLFRITAGVGLLDRMPTGIYEIWPLFNQARIPELTAKESRARVVVRPGENVVTLKFERK